MIDDFELLCTLYIHNSVPKFFLSTMSECDKAAIEITNPGNYIWLMINILYACMMVDESERIGHLASEDV